MPPICSINTSEVAAGLDALPSHWLRHFSPHSVSAASLVATYRGLKGWGRTLFAIHRDNRGRGRLLFAPQGLGPNGCVLRRTPILAWALLELLEPPPLRVRKMRGWRSQRARETRSMLASQLCVRCSRIVVANV